MKTILFVVGIGAALSGCSKHSEPAAAAVPTGSVFLGSVNLPGMVKRIEYTGPDACTLEVYGQSGTSNSFEGHCTSADGGMQFEGAGSSLHFKSVDRTDGKGNAVLAFQQDSSSGQTNDLLRVNDLQPK